MKRNIYLSVILLAAACGTMQKESDSPYQTVTDFLQWYTVNYDAVNSIPLVNQGDGQYYSVNFEETGKYLAMLQTSGLVSDSYVELWTQYFEEADENLRADSINEGPPPGFDFDLVLSTQEPDVVLDDREPQILRERSDPGKAIYYVDFDGMTLQFILVEQDGKWLIEEIRPPED